MPYFRALDPKLHVGYRKGKMGGKWVARWYVGEKAYESVTLDGVADDYQDPDGVGVLSFAQAQEQARELVRAKLAPAGPLTVEQACLAYVEYLRAEKKSADDTEWRLKKHVYPEKPTDGQVVLGDKIIAELTTDEIDAWKRGMIRRSEDNPEVERRSKDSANRVLTSVKAALNRAFNDDANRIPTDRAWRRVKPFREVGRSREVHLDRAQSKRLINVATGGFRNLVTAALVTGARPPGELASCRVKDFRADTGTLSVDGKTGQRDIVLTAEAVTFFEGIGAGKEPDALLLPKDDGTPWGKNHHQRLMADAVLRAKLPADTTIYALRHTHASQSILAGMNLKLLAENMGTSIRMLEQHYGKFIAASRRKLVEESSFKLGLPKSNIGAIGT